ncbi:MAG: DUF1254 domain-containing protein [Planctomycetota bacterium]|nr:MAG: DUF1254 domain-containing protein [Planctomycetota bacterium]
MKLRVSSTACLIVSLVLGGATFSSAVRGEQTVKKLTQQEANEIAVEAYIFAYPLITMEISRQQFTNIEPGKMIGRGPMNTFTHVPEFPPADFRAVVRPNFDTLYSTAWLDLTAEPIIVSVPDTNGRFYLLPILDMWTDVFASPGKRTTGTQAGHYAIVPACWTGDLPAGVEKIVAPTPQIWIIGRTQTNGPADYEAVHQVQKGFTLTPLSRWGKEPSPPVAVKVDPSVDMTTPPLDLVNSMPGPKDFSYAADLMVINPPHITDQPILARMKRLGIEAGKPFDFDKADPIVKQALELAPAAALVAMKAKIPTLAVVRNGWQLNTDTMGVYGTFYLKRAIISMVGLGANLPEDAIYPLNLGDRDGQPLDGGSKYTLTFKKGETPPVEAFWSVTLYDSEGFQTANSLNRFAIGDRDALKTGADGSITLYFQHDSPGADKVSNWLPAPQGPFNLTMRLYAPRSAAISGVWTPPPVVKVK